MAVPRGGSVPYMKRWATTAVPHELLPTERQTGVRELTKIPANSHDRRHFELNRVASEEKVTRPTCQLVSQRPSEGQDRRPT